MTQTGDDHVAEITQTGATVGLTQVGGRRNTARLTQEGGSDAAILQDGTDNLLAGFDPTSGLADPLQAALQSGASNLVLSQIGTNNRVFLDQSDGAVAQITQNGTNNTVTLVQRGGGYP